MHKPLAPGNYMYTPTPEPKRRRREAPTFSRVIVTTYLLMPPALQDWLPEGDLAWFILDAVPQMSLTKIERAYRADGRGSAAYRPAMLEALRCFSTTFLQIARPNPVPCHFPVVKNGSKTWGRDSEEIPAPTSLTCTTTPVN